jgi:hypothetical protein
MVPQQETTEIQSHVRMCAILSYNKLILHNEYLQSII